MDELVVVSGDSNIPLAIGIGGELGMKVPCIQRHFNDGETRVEVPVNVRGRDVFVVQSTHQPDTNILGLLIMIDALQRASAEKITVAVPYLGYARQDKKAKRGTPITAALIVHLIYAAGAHRILTTDLHSDPIQGFGPLPPRPFDNLDAAPVLLRRIRHDLRIADFRDVAFVSPDDGGIERCEKLAEEVRCSNVTYYTKRRDTEGKIVEGGAIHDPDRVEGRICLLFDDLVDTAGTLQKASRALIRAGAKSVIAACIHAVLSKDQETGEAALDRIEHSPIERLYVSDTIPLREMHPKLVRVSLDAYFALAIRGIHDRTSVSAVIREAYADVLKDIV